MKHSVYLPDALMQHIPTHKPLSKIINEVLTERYGTWPIDPHAGHVVRHAPGKPARCFTCGEDIPG